jgi:hypothetical protein
MKRCPQCLFIYPESDTRCDFDNTPLVVVDETELEAATGESPAASKPKRAPRKRKRKGPAVVAVVGLLLSVIAFAVTYYKLNQNSQNIAQIQPLVNEAPAPVTAPPLSIVSSSPVETASPSPATEPAAKPAAERIATSHSSTTVAPVSTSGPGLGKKLGGRPVILLTSGGKIDADEVWRTRDGVWYRRNGIVTLLKQGRVKSIVNQ